MASPGYDIAIVTDDPGWHGRTLTEALSKHGFKSRFVSLTDCQIHLQSPATPLSLPGFVTQPPLGVFVRGVPGGSLEQVIFRLNILHILEDMAVTVFNSGRAIERTVDKSMTSYLLHKAGVPTPPTFVFESPVAARHVLESETRAGRELVIKPLFGSQGIGIQKLTKDLLDSDESINNGLYYLQQLVAQEPGLWQDIRVLVIAGQARKAMLRRGASWITNRTQGGECLALALDDGLRELAEAAAAAVSIDYCGVDLIADKQGRLQVLEVNSIPAWWGLQQVSDEDIASLLIDAFVKKIQAASVTQSDRRSLG